MLLIVYATTIFLTASLLFVAQPMFAKMVLPLLGGSPAVWTTRLASYPPALPAGYPYAHATPSWLGARRHAALHRARARRSVPGAFDRPRRAPAPALGAAGPGPLEPHAERDHVHLGRRRGHPAALGDSPGDLSPHLRPRVRAAAPRAPRPRGPRAAHRAPGARRRAREARQPAAPPDHGAPSGGLLRGGDGVPRPAGARPPAARAPDRVLSLALGGWRPRRGLQRAGRAARLRQRGRVSADRGFGVPARAGSPGWRPRAGCARRRTARGHRRGDGGTDRGDGVGRAGGRARRRAAGARCARPAVLP